MLKAKQNLHFRNHLNEQLSLKTELNFELETILERLNLKTFVTLNSSTQLAKLLTNKFFGKKKQIRENVSLKLKSNS
jgi:hypothetical protein